MCYGGGNVHITCYGGDNTYFIMHYQDIINGATHTLHFTGGKTYRLLIIERAIPILSDYGGSLSGGGGGDILSNFFRSLGQIIQNWACPSSASDMCMSCPSLHHHDCPGLVSVSFFCPHGCFPKVQTSPIPTPPPLVNCENRCFFTDRRGCACKDTVDHKSPLTRQFYIHCTLSWQYTDQRKGFLAYFCYTCAPPSLPTPPPSPSFGKTWAVSPALQHLATDLPDPLFPNKSQSMQSVRGILQVRPRPSQCRECTWRPTAQILYQFHASNVLGQLHVFSKLISSQIFLSIISLAICQKALLSVTSVTSPCHFSADFFQMDVMASGSFSSASKL